MSPDGIVRGWVATLACPPPSPNDAFLDGLVVESVRADVRTATERSEIPVSLRDHLRRCVNHSWQFDDIWTVPPLGATALSDVAWCTQVAVIMAEGGVPFTFHTHLPDRPFLAVGGQRRRVVDELASEVVGEALTLSGLDVSPLVITRRTPRLETGMFRYDHVDRSGCPRAPSPSLVAAFRLLEEASPQYASWVRKVLRMVHQVESEPGELASSSSVGTPGAIAMSDAENPMLVAETLVHEASHQYLHAAVRLGPTVDDSDTALYWSPFRRAFRPISAILVAYHAFANVVLFYDDLERAGVDPDTAGHLRMPLAASLLEIEPILARSRALTPVGRGLFEPLRRRLAERVSR